MFNLRFGPQLCRVLLFHHFIHIISELRSLAGHILSLRRSLLDRLLLTLVDAIAPHLAFSAM